MPPETATPKEAAEAASDHYDVALSNCAREPIHIPGRVQAFGGLVGFDAADGTVRHLSENAERIAGWGQDWLGRNFLDEHDDRELIHEIRGAIGLPTIRTQRERLGQFQIAGRPVDVAVHQSGGTCIVEVEPDDFSRERPTTAVSRVRSMLGWLSKEGGVPRLLETAVDALRRTTGFDRVMAYQFGANYDGDVVAESKRPGIESFLHLRYPASDIPRQVREGLLKMPFRCIADIDTDPSIIRSLDGVPPLDVTRTHCKGVSPIHVEYLRNMGVRATIIVPIINRGELWGLFAFHHYRPRLLSPMMRSIVELFGHFFSLEIQQQRERETLSRRRQAASLQKTLREHDSEDAKLEWLLERYQGELLELLDADGVALVRADSVIGHGVTPDAVTTRRIVGSGDNDVFTLDALSDGSTTALPTGSDGTPIAGVLVMRLDPDGDITLAFFRREEVENVRWAGEPEKRIEFGPNGPRLHPRASFDEYIESVRGRSRPWRQDQNAAATELRIGLIDLVFRQTQVTGRQWQRQKEYQDLLIAELNHRVKNVLALVRSIAKQTQSGAKSLAQYTESFEARIAALATAHDLVGGSGLQWASLESMLRTELLPYAGETDALHLSGPPVSIQSDVAPVLALVIHELITNASKHGALAHDGGTLEVRWKPRGGGLELYWDESVPVRIKPPETTAFGMSLIRRAIPHECGGETSVDFRRDGLLVRLWLPGEAVRIGDTRTIEHAPADASSSVSPKPAAELPPPVAMDSKTILLVEDNMVLAMELESMLRQMGCPEVHAAGTLSDADDMVASTDFDLAILDMNLSGETSFGLAERLAGRGVPVIFISGYGTAFPVPESMRHARRLAKPVDRNRLIGCIASAFGEDDARV